ncbi:copper radical oxidase [Irpex rosettiformis]|uniref:Copper radical oxidase n=1 Tax=Irpex rosettiformis TaxID=378272 RepID=A0ACB8TXX7_9APHY|nr:copper radical oxidase [Irpex rosettiformis]
MVRSILLSATLGALAPTVIQAFSHDHRFHHPRRLQARSVPVSQWVPLGCFTDGNPGGRTLDGATFTNTTGMTTEACITFCDNQGFVYSGTEFAQECYCGNFFANGGTNTTASDCNMPCTGNSAEICGAGNRLTVFWSGQQPPPPPTTVPSVGQWVSLGCYSDSTASRTLTVGIDPTGPNSIETCTSACFNAGYPLSGTEFADECYCGLGFSNGGAPTALADCNMPCAGNSSEFCGGPNRLNVYNFTGTLPHGPEPPAGGGGGGGNTGAPVFPVLTGLPSGFSYVGCYVDNAFGRIFSTELPDNQNLTVESCVTSCSGQNFNVSGVEFGVQCFCGNELINGAVAATDGGCDMSCGGNATEACGGPNRLSVYSSTGTVTSLPVPTVKNTSLPGQWTYQGCLQEPGPDRVFPYQIINSTSMTVESCLAQCSDFGYPAGGLEFGDECWCGDVSDVAANSPGFAPETDCVIPCAGDPIHLCGGAQRLQYYTWNGTLNLWHTPANTGRYEFLIGGVVVPLVVTLGTNNKIAMVEKFGTSEFANSTGAYELDLTLTDNFEKAWRTMHVKSDVFCSGSIVLPDKGARQLNVGGWSLDSTKGVRLYWPDGSAGVNGTNDWEENFEELHLQRQRWYPTALIMANGSILVVGGEVGSNGAPEPSLEILPKPDGTGDTWMFLDYLNRTDPNNLYPFLHVLPSGRIFIGYYNEARILDPVSLETFQVLPNMPGSVTSPLAGRTYPMEGTAVLMPQHAPYTDPVTVLVCGGSNFGIALDNCVSIQPEAENPTWTLERMPSKRVMTCIAPLPDGTYLIVNGAQQGVAGFGLADNPNFSALLYDPTQPIGQRISILNNTIVARLYHSEATLLFDGRVLISGSDPQTNNPDGTPKFPEEMRIEVYIPPYLSEGRTQPNFTIAADQTDWSYNGQYTIDVNLFHGTTSTMRVSLIAATSSTHGNAMGARTIFPEFKCAGTGAQSTCTITAPPNANVSPPGWHQLFVLDGPTPSFSKWVRIGGDPGRLGEWPNFPDFSLPGV